jgi:hypothetical protein
MARRIGREAVIVYTDKHRVPFQIDEGDYEAVSRYPWHIGSRGYPMTKIGKWPTATTVALHQFLLGPASDGFEWDHRDRDKLNNQRSNIRELNRPANVRNTGLRKTNTSGVKCVHWVATSRKWRARITLERGPQKHLGYFLTLDAAEAACRIAYSELFGDSQ